MKKPLFFALLLLYSLLVKGQNGGIRILPEAGISVPIGDFEAVNVFAKQGIQAGLHLEKMWRNVGLGLYGGIGKNDIQFPDLLPASSPSLPITSSENLVQYHWQQYLLGLGPVLKLNLSKKINLELTSKLGISKFSYPDFGKFAALGDPVNQVYTLYQTRNEELEKKVNPMVLSALRLNIRVSKRVDLSLAGNYAYVRDVRHTYSYLDAVLSPDMSNDALVQSLRTAPTVIETRKCHFNTIGATIGLSFNLGGKDKPRDKMDPPVPDYPADGAIITMEEADSLTLEWRSEQPKAAKANYNLWLYSVSESENNQDSLIFQTKVNRSLTLLLPSTVKLATGGNYRWKVQAVDDARLKACPSGCYSKEANFSITAAPNNQYYHLLSQNSGNYLEASTQLSFILPPYIELGGAVEAVIINQNGEAVWRAEGLAPGRTEESYQVDAQSRVRVELRRFPRGYYFLEVKNERNEKYYLRFKTITANETRED